MQFYVIKRAQEEQESEREIERLKGKEVAKEGKVSECDKGTSELHTMMMVSTIA